MLLLLVMGAIFEIIVWIIVAQFISGWLIFLWTIFAFIIGIMLIIFSIQTIMPELKNIQLTGQVQLEGTIGKRLLIAMSGLFLAIPGLTSDLIAFLILLPFTQKLVKNAISVAMMKRQQKFMNDLMNNMGINPENPFSDMKQQREHDIIDVEAREVKPENKMIDYSKKL